MEITGEQIQRAKAPYYLFWSTLPILSLSENIRDAAQRWQEKYGTRANAVYIASDDMPEGVECIVLEGCEVRGRRGVRPGTLWCGWEAR